MDGFVIGDAGADGIGYGDAACTIGGEQPWHSQHGVGAKHQGIQEVVVDAPINHVNTLRALGGAHEYRFIADEQILAFNQFDAHLLSQEGVLEVSTVVRAGG